MKSKPIIPRTAASRDIDAVIDHYLGEGGGRAALGFIAALERAYTHLSRHAASGSLRYAHDLELPGVRCWQVRPYPYLIFYTEQKDHLDVWRVLHASRDIPAWLRNDGDR